MPNEPISKPSTAARKSALSRAAQAKATAKRVVPKRARSTAGKHPTKAADEIVPAVIARAQQMGLLSETQQVGARLPAKLLKQARKRTGLSSNTDLLTFALASVAVEDNFADAFVAARGKLDPDLDIGF